MKVIHLLCGFCFLLFFSYSAQAQRGGGVSTGCNLIWSSTANLIENDSYFTGSGSAFTVIPNFNSVNGQAINGWVNYVIEANPDTPFFTPATIYTMTLQLGTTFLIPLFIQFLWFL